MAALTALRAPGSRMLVFGAGMAVVSACALALGARVDAARAAFGYLTAYCFAVSIAVGALLLLMLGYAINAVWMSAIRRLCEAVSMALLPLAVLFAPVVLWADQLYPWLHPDAAATEELHHTLVHNQPYLNLPFFVARAALYFVLWIVPALLLRLWSTRRRADTEADPIEALHRERGLSAGMLLPAVLAVTFGAFDWMMSLEPGWFSTAYGLYFLNGAAVGAVATVIILAHLRLRRDGLTPNHFHALGRVLFAFVILWTYVAYFQLFLIFITDRPNEIAFYLARGHGEWKRVGPALAIGHFAIPVLLLARKAWKFHSGFVAAVAGWLLVMHYADLYYLIMPVHSPESATPSWIDAAALLAVCGSCLAFCAWMQRGLPWIALHDPLLPRGLRYRSGQ